MKGKEVEVYAVHFTQQNTLPKVMNEEAVNVLKKFGGAMGPCKDTSLYLGSFVFRTPALRDEFCRACDDLGIYFTVETEGAYIPAEDLPEEWQQ